LLIDLQATSTQLIQVQVMVPTEIFGL